MKLIPAEIIKSDSAAEKRVFNFLKQFSYGPADTALHSLNIGHHEYKRWGEADFLIISRRGILLLEVKGGRVACKDGYWEFTNRFGDKNTKRESPAAQASSAFFSLEKNYLKPILGRELSRIPAGFGVVCTDVPRFIGAEISRLPEHPDEITAYDVDCKGHNTFREYMDRAFDHWSSKRERPVELQPDVINKIVAKLRPNFERVPSLDSQLRHAAKDLCQFTDEQYERMDEIADNDRILISGGAGTGKTFVAAACARYEASDEQNRVLLVTRSPFLATFLRSHSFPENVTIATLDEVPALIDRDGPWNVLIIDEGQDLCDLASLEILERALLGGWQRGRWRWFGDPNHQVSPSYPFDPDCHGYLRELSFRCHLKQNVRNAGRVVEAIVRFSGADVGHAKGAPDRGQVKLEEADDAKEMDARVLKTLKGWLSGEDPPAKSAIAVLVDDDADPEKMARMISSSGIRTEVLSERALGPSKRSCVLVARIEDFKGLERPLVCVAGIEGDATAVAAKAYRAMSRANHELVLILGRGPMAELAKRAAAIAVGEGRS